MAYRARQHYVMSRKWRRNTYLARKPMHGKVKLTSPMTQYFRANGVYLDKNGAGSTPGKLWASSGKTWASSGRNGQFGVNLGSFGPLRPIASFPVYLRSSLFPPSEVNRFDFFSCPLAMRPAARLTSRRSTAKRLLFGLGRFKTGLVVVWVWPAWHRETLGSVLADVASQ